MAKTLQDIRWSTFWFLLLEIFIYFIISSIFSQKLAVVIVLATLIIFILIHIYWIYKLSNWVESPSLKNLPNGTGIWQNIFAKLYRTYRQQKKSQTQLTTTLDQFIQAAEAINDGIVGVNEDNEILWSNKKAQKMLNINPKKDYNQPINYIFRNSDLSNYLIKENYENSINIHNTNNKLDIEIKATFFSENHKLITCRDLTSLKKIQNLRKDFVSNFSHELKTPLTVISGFLETLEDRKKIDVQSKKIISLMSEQAHRMKKLIDDLLLLSNVESDYLQNRSEKVIMRDIFKKIKNEVSFIDQQQHKISYSLNNEINIYGSSTEIYSAFINLLTNAIRYTDKKGEITVSWNKINNDAIFQVADTGIGIPEKHLKRITERFYRVDEDRSRESGGTGLGLSIVKNIMHQHQGEIRVASEINSGSSFKLIFPSERIYTK
ncbi:phosphate regulon sensor histidine kinase PhoR [Methylophilaceae bacterium]|nr:phosphate regulon sensor histidine kinase PhoR [Methylophilaceae bacterium]MDC1173034.1 phosphate regulon sensor histidine kinase PhoR [Methylophilaceae bacterium]